MNFLNHSTYVLGYLTQLWYVCDSIALTASKKISGLITFNLDHPLHIIL